MPGASRQNNANALCSTLAYLLETISERGYWKDPQESWEPILACVAVEALLEAGLRIDHCWVIQQAGHPRMTIEIPLRWLNSRIQSDGRFGTDFWDACRLGLLIETHSLHGYFQNYSELRDHLVSVHTTNTILVGDSDWVGPGFLAAAADYLDRIGKHAEADTVVQRLRSMQEQDGRWSGTIGTTGHPLVSPVWHTSQAVLTLSRKHRSEHREAINTALGWIRNAQDPLGKWPDTCQYVIYSTCYAILALLQAEVRDQPAINRGLDYLKSCMRPDGRFQDLGGTLMVAIALLAVTRYHIDSDLAIADHVLARLAKSQMDAAEGRVVHAEEESAKLRARNEELERKYHNADFGVTKKQLFLIGPLLAVLLSLFVAIANRTLTVIWPMPGTNEQRTSRSVERASPTAGVAEPTPTTSAHAPDDTSQPSEAEQHGAKPSP